MSFLEKVDYPESATNEYSKKFLQFIFLKTLEFENIFKSLEKVEVSLGSLRPRYGRDGRIINYDL